MVSSIDSWKLVDKKTAESGQRCRSRKVISCNASHLCTNVCEIIRGGGSKFWPLRNEGHSGFYLHGIYSHATSSLPSREASDKYLEGYLVQSRIGHEYKGNFSSRFVLIFLSIFCPNVGPFQSRRRTVRACSLWKWCRTEALLKPVIFDKQRRIPGLIYQGELEDRLNASLVLNDENDQGQWLHGLY